jgi:hypothetical protein
MRRVIAALLLTLAVAWGASTARDGSWSAHAQLPVTHAGLATPASGGGGYTGEGDVASGALFYYGTRAYNAAYATGSNPAFDYSCSGGSPSTGTIKILSTGYADAATLSAACGANAITTTKIYDQTGHGYNLTTIVGSVAIKLNCISTYPCLQFAGASNADSSVGALTQAQPLTVVAAAQRTGSFTSVADIVAMNSQYGFNNVANEATMYAGSSVNSSTGTASIPDNAFNAIQYIANSTSSEIYANGTPNPASGNVGTVGATGSTIVIGSEGSSNWLTGYILEVATYPGASTTLSGMNSNMHAAYGGY